jgi:hypothetical protein
VDVRFYDDRMEEIPLTKADPVAISVETYTAGGLSDCERVQRMRAGRWALHPTLSDGSPVPDNVVIGETEASGRG